MGFFGPEPFDQATATYVWAGLREPGFLLVEVSGEAPNFTTGIELVRDPHWVGGVKLDVMGWTGPVGEGTTPYKVSTTLPGSVVESVVVAGSNKREAVPVTEVPAEEADDFLRQRAAA